MENKVLAVVGGCEVKESDLNNVVKRYPRDKQAFFTTDQGKKQLLDQVIGFELMYQFGKKNGYDSSEEYKIELEKLQKELLTQLVVNKVLSEITITDEEALEFYNGNQEMFKQPETVSAKHILVATEEACKNIKEEIVNGKLTFEEAARKYSTCPSKDNDGNLGDFSKGMMVPEFEDVAFTLSIGEVSEPVKTQFGFHLIKVESKNEAINKPFEEVKSMVVNQLMQERQQKKYVDFIEELKKQYGVEIK